MTYLDEDAVNQIVLEERHQEQEERQLRNKILSMSNLKRKREEWNKHFPHFNHKTNLIF